MPDPLSGLRFPADLAKRAQSYLPEGAELTLVILTEVYSDPQCESRLERVAEQMIRDHGFRLVGVEGAEGLLDRETTREYAGRSIESLVSSSAPISAGIAHLIHSSGHEFEAWGVDLEEARSRQAAAMTRVLLRQDACAAFFAELRSELEPVRRKVHTQEVRELGEALFSLYGNAPPLKDQARRVARLAGRIGIDLGAYRVLAGIQRVGEIEDRQDPRDVQQESNQLIQRVADRALGWWKRDGNVVSFDEKLLVPVVCLWLRKTQRTKADLQNQVAAEGLENTLVECKKWIEDWLVGGALEVRLGTRPVHEYFEDLILLGLGLGVDVLSLRQLREYVLTSRIAASLELEDYAKELADCGGLILEALCERPEQRDLLEIERRAEMLFKAWRLVLGPRDFEHFLTLDRSLRRLAGDLAVFGTRNGLAVADFLEDLGEDVFTFYSLSRRRGQHMLEQTVRLLRERREERGLLVCGGFHVEIAVRHLKQRYPEIGWSVVQPQPNLPGDLRRGESAPVPAAQRAGGWWRRVLEALPWK